jgi:flavin-dependent dehydrogenase
VTALTTETTTTANAFANGSEDSHVFHVEHRCGRTGHRVELARYTISAGERVIYGQRVNGVVRFLPRDPVVVVASLGPTEDSTCRSRTTIGAEGCADAVRRKRRNGPSEPRCLLAGQREHRP